MNRSVPHAFEPEEIMAYLDGELEAQQAAALASHLEHCSECGVLAIRLRQISERMLDFQVEPSPATLEAPIVAALDSSVPLAKPRFEAERKPRRPVRGLAWVVASIAVIIVGGSVLLNLMRSRVTTSQMREVAQLAMRPSGTDSNGVFWNRLPVPEGKGAASSAGRELNSIVTRAGTNSFSTDVQARAEQPIGIVGGIPGGRVTHLRLQAGEGIEAPELRGPMIVQTASITILATNYDQASGAIQRVTSQHGGYIQDMTADTRTGMARSVSATLRVPDKQLEAFLADLQKLGHVEQETRNNQEITDQYIDLTARLRTARATERRVIDLLGNRTGKLSDVLDAERELARIRGEIESMEGQRVNMQHQVSYATVQVQLNEEYREQLNAQTYSTGTRVRNSLVDGFKNLAGGAVGLVIFLFAFGPSILFWLALFGVPAWFVWRHYRRPRAA